MVNSKIYETLDERIRKINDFKKHGLEGFENRLNEIWAHKEIQPIKKRIVRDDDYSDLIWFEGRVTYHVVHPPFSLDLLSVEPLKFGIKGGGSEVKLRTRKEPLDYWQEDWEKLSDLNISQKDLSIPFPPEIIGKDISRSINDMVYSIEYKPPKYFMESFEGNSFGEKVYDALLSRKTVTIHPNRKVDREIYGEGVFDIR